MPSKLAAGHSRKLAELKPSTELFERLTRIPRVVSADVIPDDEEDRRLAEE